jgi:hypothetical protein
VLSREIFGQGAHGVKALIQKIFAQHKERTDRVLFSSPKRKKIPFEIAMDLFPGIPPSEVFLGTSNAVQHLKILTEQRSVRGKENGGKWVNRSGKGVGTLNARHRA